jgi:hypothetical protein
LIDNLIGTLPAEDQGMFTGHAAVFRDLHIATSMHGLTADVTAADECLPFTHRKELPLRAPGIRNQCPDDAACVALAHVPTNIGFWGWGYHPGLAPLGSRGNRAHICPVAPGGDDLCSLGAFLRSLL